MLYDRGHKIENEIQYVSYTTRAIILPKIKMDMVQLFYASFLFICWNLFTVCRVFEIMNLSNTCVQRWHTASAANTTPSTDMHTQVYYFFLDCQGTQ